MEWLWEKIKEGLLWVIDMVTLIAMSMMETLWDILKDFFLWVVDETMGLAVSLLNVAFAGFDFNPGDYIDALPDEVTNILGLIGLGEATTIIMAAIMIRLLLQLIPFVRLGS